MFVRLGVAQRLIEVIAPNQVEAYFKGDQSAAVRLAAVKEGWAIDPSKFLYMRVRMVSAVEKHGPNANGDAFQATELASRYATFVNSPINIDHDNDSILKAVGFIVDARYLPEEMYVEGVHAIDRIITEARRPGLVQAIADGVIRESSMGCYVERSLCSECLREAGWDGKDFSQVNKIAELLSIGHGIATVPSEYCRHIGKNGERKGGMSGPYEFNQGVTFFEDSIITTQAADRQALYLERLASADGDWRKKLICRKPTEPKEGGDSMKPIKTAEELRMDTIQEPGDNGSAPEKDKALHDQAKGNSGKVSLEGNPTVTLQEKGDYILAQLKLDPALLAHLKTRMAVDPTASTGETPEMGGAPPVIEKNEKKNDDVAAGAAKERMKDTDVPPVAAPPTTVPAPEKKVESGLFERIVASIKVALDGFGNPTATSKEGGDYPPSAGDPDKNEAAEAKGTSGKTDEHGNPIETAQDPSDHPHTGAAVVVAEEGKENERANSIVKQMKDGKPFEEAKGTVEKALGCAASRIARRQQIADEIENRGSMGEQGEPFKTVASPDPAAKGPVPVPGQGQGQVVPPPAVKAVPPPVTKDNKDTDPKPVVSALDSRMDALEAVMKVKRAQAEMMARAGYKVDAATDVKHIAHMEKTVAEFDRVASLIEELDEARKKTAGIARDSVNINLQSRISEAKRLMAEADKFIDEVEKDDKGKDEKVAAARRIAQLEASNKQKEGEAVEYRNRLKAEMKSRAIKTAVDLGQKKGLIQTAAISTWVSRLAQMSEVEFEATRKAWASLPDRQTTASYIPRTVREASRRTTEMGVPVEASASADCGDLENNTIFGNPRAEMGGR